MTILDRAEESLNGSCCNTTAGGAPTLLMGDANVMKRQILIYCPSRRLVDSTVESILEDINIQQFMESFVDLGSSGSASHGRKIIVKDVMCYYANLHKEVKEQNQRKWMLSGYELWNAVSEEKKGTCAVELQNTRPTHQVDVSEQRAPLHIIFQVMVATCAFGTGINSKQVAAVIHLGFARSLAEYAQESGRAGRDGIISRCTIIYSKRVAEKYAKRLADQVPESILAMANSQNYEKLVTSFETRDGLRIRATEQAFAQFISWVETRGECRRSSLAAYLDGSSSGNCLHSNVVMNRSPCDNYIYFIGISQANMRRCALETNSHKSSGTGDKFEHQMTQTKGQAKSRIVLSDSPKQFPSFHLQFENNKRPAAVAFCIGRNNQNDGASDGRHKKSMKLSLKQYTQCDTGTSGRDNETYNLTVGSSETNRALLTDERRAVAEIISEFHADVDEIKGVCIVCFALTGERHPESENLDERRKCYKMRKVCYRCLRQKCSYTACPVLGRSITNGSRAKSGSAQATKPKSVCRDCGLMNFRGEYIHPWNEFGTRCGIKRCLHVCMGAWYIASIRREIICRYNLSEDWNSPQEAHQIAFLQWLRQMDSTGEKLNVMRVFHDILHENQ